MIILDTNVLSELLRPLPDKCVLAWMSSLSSQNIYTTTIVESEILYGLKLMPSSLRRDSLYKAVCLIFNEDFSGRVLSFDRFAAAAYAEIASQRKAKGHPISQFDAMIAAIAFCNGAVLATRNSKDFRDCHIDVVNPWDFKC